MEKELTIVGCGPGSLSYMTGAALDAVRVAEVLIGAQRLMEMFPDAAAERIVLSGNYDRVLDLVCGYLGRKRVALLVTGDPGLHSAAKKVIERFGRTACRVIPGISSVQTAFARIGIDWQNARIISAHTRNPEITTSIREQKKIAVLAGGEGSRSWLQDLAGLLGDDFQVFLCSDLTLENEKVEPMPAEALVAVPLPSRSIILFIHRDEI